MSRWTKLALSLPKLRGKVEGHEFEAAESQCSEYIKRHSDERSDKLTGVYMVRAHCRAALGRTAEALSDHLEAVSMIDLYADCIAIYDVANDAMNAGIPLDHCASLLSECAENMLRRIEASDGSEAEDDAAMPDYALVAAAYNKEGICRYRAEAPIEQEINCYIKAKQAIETIEGPDEDDILLGALINSNLAECLARNGDYIEAAGLYRSSCDIYEQRKKRSAVCTDQYAMCLRSLSDISRATGDNITAHNYLTQTINLLEKHPDGASENVIAQLSSCHNARGTLRFHIGDYTGEISDCTAALELRKHIPADHFALATIHANRAEAYEHCEDFEAAAEDYKAAIGELEQIADTVHDARAFICIRLYALGEAYKAQELLREAMDAYQRCADGLLSIRGENFQELSRAQLNDTEAFCRMWIAQLALGEPFTDYHIALTETRRAIALFEDSEPSTALSMRISFLHSVLGEIYEMFDEHDSAAEEYRIAQEILDNAFSEGDTEEDNEVDDEDSVWDDPSGTIPQA